MTVKIYFCDLCGKAIEQLHTNGLLNGNAYMLSCLVGERKRIDLCDKCLSFIRKNGYIEEGEKK